MAKDERSNAILDRKLSILKRHDLLPLWKKLYLAAEAGCCRTVVQCLDDNPPPTISDISRALRVAATHGHAEVARILLENGTNPDWIDEHDRFGWTVLHSCVANPKHKYRRESVVRVLIEFGAHIHAKDKFGRTPLHLARTKMMVNCLIQAGASLEATDNLGRTPLHRLCIDNQVAKAAVDALLSAGADVNARDKNGNTVLHNSAAYHCNSIAKLVAAGADLDCTNNDGKTPRDVASYKGRLVMDRARLAQPSEAQVPPDRVMLMFCGNGMVGKTMLTKALEHGKVDSDHLIDSRTYGFDSFGAVIPHAGKCTMVDFGGQPEFWVPHGVFLGNRSGVYLVVVNLGDSSGKQRSQLRHWLRFIVSRSSVKGTRPQVAVVGSHRGGADSIDSLLKARSHRMTRETQERLIARIERLESIALTHGRHVSATLQDSVRRLHAEFVQVLDIASEPFLIESINPDAIDSAELIRLQQWLGTAFDHIRETRQVPQVCLKVAGLVPRLRQMLPPISTYADVMAALKDVAGDLIDFSREARNRAILSHLWEAGYLMVFEGVGDAVVVDPQAFGTHVIGQLFCPHGDPDFRSLVVDEKDGYVFRLSQLEEHLAQVREHGRNFGDAQHALRLLTALELIIPLPTTRDAVDDDPVFAIPGRLNQGDSVLEEYRRRPSECWSAPTHLEGWVYLGVRLKLKSTLSLIPPSEFPRLQHRLSKKKGFRMWRHGLCVRQCTTIGLIKVEGLIELNETLEYVDVCVRSEVGDEEGAKAARQVCIDELKVLVAACSRVSPHFECMMLVAESLRKHVDSERVVADGVGPVEREGLQPVEWLMATLRRRADMMDTMGPLAPDVLISYSTKVDPDCVDDKQGKELTLHIASLLGTHDISCFHGLMVPPGEVWWHHWFGRVAGCKVAIVVLSPAYFASAQCIRELNALLEHKKELRIIPVVARAGVSEAMKGDFLGTTERGQLQAAGIRALFRTNWLPPPDEAGGVYRMECPQNDTLLIETVQAQLRELQS